MDKKVIEEKIGKLVAKQKELESEIDTVDMIEEEDRYEKLENKINAIKEKVGQLKSQLNDIDEDDDEVIDNTDDSDTEWYTSSDEKAYKQKNKNKKDDKYEVTLPSPGNYSAVVMDTLVASVEGYGTVVKMKLQMEKDDGDILDYTDSFFINSNEVAKEKLAKFWLLTGGKLTELKSSTVKRLNGTKVSIRVKHSENNGKIYANLYYNKLIK